MALIDSNALTTFDGLNYITDSGFVMPATSEIKETVETAFKSNDMFGGDFDTTEENIGGRLIEGVTRLLVETLGMCAVNSNQLNFEYALGRYLDVHASFYGLSRNGSTSTTVVCALGGEANLTVPQGALVEDDDGNSYALSSSVTLNSSGIGYGTFACTKPGKLEVPVGSITTIQSGGVLGWDTVENLVVGVSGQDVESDDSLRSRIREARKSGIGYLSGIRSKIMEVAEVKECLIYENYFGSPIWVSSSGDISMTYVSGQNTVGLKSHSILVVADYPESDDTDYSVAEAIYMTKSCGSGMTPILTNPSAIDYANESATVHIPTENDQSTYLEYVKNIQYLDTKAQAYYGITFNKPFRKWAYVEVSISKNIYVGTSSDLRKEIITAIDAFQQGNSKNVDGLTIGQNILAFEMAAAISDEIPSIQVRSVQFFASWEKVADRPQNPDSLGPNNVQFVTNSGDTTNEINIKMSQKGFIDTTQDVRVKIDGVIVSNEGA